jgi:hypothetical protein
MAIAEFKGATHNRNNAALFEHGTPEILTASLGNIPPKIELRAEVSLVMLLKDKIAHSTGISTLTILTYIAPRYGQTPSDLLLNAKSSDAKRSLDMIVEVTIADEIHHIVSKTHDISVQINKGP